MVNKAILFAFCMLMMSPCTSLWAHDKELTTTPAKRHTGLLTGKVVDENGSPVPGATMRLNKYNIYTISTSDGSFAFLNVPADSYVLTTSYLGFATNQLSVVVKNGENTKIKVQLKETSSNLKGVLITARASDQARALNRQKTNSNISNVISSDLVERFPDANMGDALKRVTGITVQNDQGEARNIIIRGLSPELNSVALNGNRIPSAEGNNRNVQMDLIPVELISAVTVNKTLLPDMDADAIGGAINLETRAASRKRFSISLAPGYNPIRSSMSYQFSVLYSNRFFNNHLGLIGTLSYHVRDYGSDNIEAKWDVNKKGLDYMSDFQIRKYDVWRGRRAATLGADYVINDNNKLNLSATYSWRDDRENRFSTRYKGITPVYDDQGQLTHYMTKSINRQVKGGIDNSRNKDRRLEDQRMFSVMLKGDHLLGEKLNLTWETSFSRASEDRPHERYITYAQKKVSGMEQESDINHPVFIPQGEIVNKFMLQSISEQKKHTQETEWGFRVDARTPFSLVHEQKGRLRYGLRLRLKDKNRTNNYFEYSPLTKEYNVLANIPQLDLTQFKLTEGNVYSPGIFPTAKFLGQLDLSNRSLFKETDVPEEYYALNYKAHEDIYAAYLRYDQNITEKLSFITGIRVENTHIKYTGHSFLEKHIGNDVTKTNSYIDLLPNLTLRYQPMDKMVLRAAYSTALARPNYYALVPYRIISQKDNLVGAGNPDLKATYSHNVDVMADYYLPSLGAISAGAFFKRLNNFIYQYKDTKMAPEAFAHDFPEMANPIQGDVQWTYETSRNGSHVNVYGFEFSVSRNFAFIPVKFFKYLNGTVNYTYTHSKAYGATDAKGNKRTDVALPGTAPHMFNASLAWDNKIVDARASLNYTSAYIDALGQSSYYDVYYDKQLFLDVNVGVHVKHHWHIFAEGKNLTNQPLRYYQATKNHPIQLEYYGRIFNLGVKYTL